MTGPASPEGPDEGLREQEIERACKIMHDAYEAAAALAGWETQRSSRVPWSGVPEANKVAMRAAVRALFDHLRAALSATATGAEPDDLNCREAGFHVRHSLATHTDAECRTGRIEGAG